MEKVFYELVIEGHLPVIKGFVYGLLEGSKKKGTVIFTRENNIKSETYLELLMEWTHLHETLRYLVIEEGLLELIKQGLENTADLLKLNLKSIKRIKKASFNFHYEVYARKYGEEIKNFFSNLPPQLKISPDYQPKEEVHPEEKGLGAYAPLHTYILKAKGTVEGPIDILLLFYKKVQENDLIKKSQINLHFDEAGSPHG